MKILFVAMVHSVHAQRWITQLTDQGWDIHIFPSMDTGQIHPGFRNVTVHHSIYSPQPDIHPSVRTRGLKIGFNFLPEALARIFRFISRGLRFIHRKVQPDHRIYALQRVIERVQPDIVHAIEFQHGAYLALEVKQKMGDRFPTWIVTNYGSDLYLFGRLAEHRDRVRKILELCDYYDCECQRDIRIAQDMGLKGKTLPVLPNAGGFDLEHIARIPRLEPTSSRRQILLKGYQHFAGRALAGIQAIRQCADLLGDYRIVIYSSSPDVRIAAELMALDTGLQLTTLAHISHDDILSEQGRSRIYLGLSISDAISTSLLEAMVMGAFPIQSNTACADEWIEEGISGITVPPEDVNAIASALRRAITNDELVDQAARINYGTVQQRLDMHQISQDAIRIYDDIYRSVYMPTDHQSQNCEGNTVS